MEEFCGKVDFCLPREYSSGMKGERILIADDQSVVIEGVKSTLAAFGQEAGHKIVGEAHSKEEVEELLKGGLKPTLALVDGKFIKFGDGEEVAKVVRALSPETYIVSFSSDPYKWGDTHCNKLISGRDLVNFLTSIQH